jgi:hypothetical protein
MIGATNVKTCLRCDWGGDTKRAACPDRGVRLVISVSNRA